MLSRAGAPGQIAARWLAGEFELVVSPLLLAELERALASRKVRARVGAPDAAAFVTLLRETALVEVDPRAAPPRSPDPGDDYLVALAQTAGAFLVSGDEHLLGHRFPVRTPRLFLEALEGESRAG